MASNETQFVKKRNGRLEPFQPSKINRSAEKACYGIPDVNPGELVLTAKPSFPNKIPTSEINEVLILAAKTLSVRKDPAYTYVAARLRLEEIYKNVFGEGVDSDVFDVQYRKSFITRLKQLIKAGKVDPQLKEKFNLRELAATINPEADSQFNFLGIQTVYDKYLLKVDGHIMESPQAWLMRVAMGLSLNEPNPTESAKKIYEMYSSFRFLSSTPTLFNSGTTFPQMSSCFLNVVDDSLEGIMGVAAQNAQLSKFSGGLGTAVTKIRSAGSKIKSTGGESSGPVPFLKILESVIVAFNQGGRRKGVNCVYIEPWHKDIESFLKLRENTGDERMRTHDLNTALWIPDLFMKLSVEHGNNWYLFDPAETPELTSTFGEEWEALYHSAVERAIAGEISYTKTTARELWAKILVALLETGHPWINFKDSHNERYTCLHEGIVHSSNLCTEISLHTKPTVTNKETGKTTLGETAVCNLASINLSKHVVNKQFDWEKLRETVYVAIRALDNVIDLSFYPAPEAKNANQKHRPIGLGIMGWKSALSKIGLAIDSPEAEELAGDVQEFISYHSVIASINLAKERGSFSTFKGSLWSKGILPVDTFNTRAKTRLGLDRQVEPKLDWEPIRTALGQYGIRNSMLQAIAPTATIANIVGVSHGNEPRYSNFYVKSNQSGEFLDYDPELIQELKEKGLWTRDVLSGLARSNGDVSQLDIPAEIKRKYKTCFQVDVNSLIRSAANRQVWIDQAQSLNLFMENPNLPEAGKMYYYAWQQGLKGTYYLRTTATSGTEKMTDLVVEEAVVEETPLPACAINDPDCESCQ